ncbi:protein of unknown function [Cupriavidus taiwanensis]|uniref:Uncharacterized protein n=1 Tax=Cupriavidus taiwanensis TaxID=164546 RepID=A0A9Q7UTP0_9BURK|nr:protein of unknown function [Cupriavidus taiwanensis]
MPFFSNDHAVQIRYMGVQECSSTCLHPVVGSFSSQPSHSPYSYILCRGVRNCSLGAA